MLPVEQKEKLFSAQKCQGLFTSTFPRQPPVLLQPRVRWGSSRHPRSLARPHGTRQSPPYGCRAGSAGRIPLQFPAEGDRGRSQQGGCWFFPFFKTLGKKFKSSPWAQGWALPSQPLSGSPPGCSPRAPFPPRSAVETHRQHSVTTLRSAGSNHKVIFGSAALQAPQASERRSRQGSPSPPRRAAAGARRGLWGQNRGVPGRPQTFHQAQG